MGILRAHRVAAVADVRRFPQSRRFPHFNAEALAVGLPKMRLQYVSFASLGGRRRARKDSINTGWRNNQFRGYADFMQTPDFVASLNRLVKLATETPTAIMCAEALPWRCHRQLIADALVVRGSSVFDIFSDSKIKPHAIPSFARVEGDSITYPEAGLFTVELQAPNRRAESRPTSCEMSSNDQ